MKKPKVFVLFAVLILLTVVGFGVVFARSYSEGDYGTRDYIEYPWEKGLCPANEDNAITVQQWAIIMPHLPQWLPDYMRTYDSAYKYWSVVDNYRDNSVFTLTAWHNRNDSDKFVFALKRLIDLSVYEPYITMVDHKGYDVKLGLYTDFLCEFGIPYYGTPLLNNIPLWPAYLPQEYDVQRGGSRYLGFLENGRPLENPGYSEEKYTGKKDYIPYPWFNKDLNAPINKQKITYDEWEIIAAQLPDDLPRSLRDYYSQFTYWCVDKYPTTVFLTAYYEDDKDNLKHETYFLELNDLFKPFG